MPTECERSETSPNEVQTLQNQPDKQIPQMQQQHEEGGSEGVVVGAGAGGASGSGGEAVDSQIPELTREEKINALEKMEFNKEVQGLNGEMSSSQTSTTSSNNSLNGSIISNGSGKKTSLISPDPTAYVTKARVTRPTPPPPPYNPMQFVQIKPCSLYQTAHQQLKKAEEVKKIKEIKKEEPEDWQNNLDNWKSSRRKRVEHIIDRVVEVKKLELEEHDRTRRKSKTFSEMMEERGERGRGLTKLASLAVYNEDESNDFSDLGIGTSSASGKSSLSEDYDNNSVLSDNNEMDKTTFENKQKLNNSNSTTREYTSSPGYETSSSTAAASSPDPCEYTYEGAIQDYKQRVSRATSNSANNYSKFYGNSNGGTNTNTNLNPIPSKSPFKTSTTMANNELSNPDPDHFNKTNPNDGGYPTRRGSKIEDRLSSFEVTSPSDTQENAETKKVDVPKIDISKRKEIFEQQKQNDVKPLTNGGNGQVPKVALRDRFNFEANNAGNSSAVKQPSPKKDVKRLSGDITSIKERLQSLEQQKNSGSNGTNEMTKSSLNASKVVDIPVPPLKERLSSLQNAVTKEEVKKPPVALVDARQLEIMKNEEEKRMKLIKEQQKDQDKFETQIQSIPKETIKTFIEEEKKASMNVQEAGEKRTKVESDDVDRDDSGIHTADDIDSEERLNEQLETNAEEQLNAAIAALALEEKQLEEAANAVNKIEKEFAELEAPVQIPVKAQHSSVPTPQRQPLIPQQSQPKPQPQPQAQQQQQPQAQLQAQPSLIEMEFSINEALESALEEIDKEVEQISINKQQQQQQQQREKENINLQQNQKENEIQITKTIIMNNQNINSNNNNNNYLVENVNENHKINNMNANENIADEIERRVAKEPIYENIQQTQTGANINTNTYTNTNLTQSPPLPLKEPPTTFTPQLSSNAITKTTITKTNINNSNNNNNNNISMHHLDIDTEIIPNKNNFNLLSNSNQSQINQNFINHNNNVDININNDKFNENLINANIEKNNFLYQENINEIMAAKQDPSQLLVEQELQKQDAFITATNNNAILTSSSTTVTTSIPITTNKTSIQNNAKQDLGYNEDLHQQQDIRIEEQPQPQQKQNESFLTSLPNADNEPYYQVPKSSEPYYDAPKHLRPIPVYENIEIFYNGLDSTSLNSNLNGFAALEPPKEKPPPPPCDSPPLFDDIDSANNTDTWSSTDNTYETIPTAHLRQQNGHLGMEHPSPPIKRMNSTKRIKKELRNKRSSFLGIEDSLDNDDSYLELSVAPPPDMAQLLQEERRLEKQMFLKAGLCDSSDTGESRDSGVSENHSRQSSEHYTNSSEENESHNGSDGMPSLKQNDLLYQNESPTALLTAAQTPLLQTVKGNSAESWTESATVAAAATKSLTEAQATANAKMLCIEEKIREQEEVLRVERELLQFSHEELKRQRENLLLRENMARMELQHGAKMLMSANRHSLQDLNGLNVPNGVMQVNNGFQPTIVPQATQALRAQHIYANVPNLQQQYYRQADMDYRKSMSDLNEFSKRLTLPPVPPTKPMRAMHISTNGLTEDYPGRQRHSLNANPSANYGGSLVKIATPLPTAAPRNGVYSNLHHQSAQNLNQINVPITNGTNNTNHVIHHGNMTRNTLHALSATPKPKYTDDWVQVQTRKTFESSANLANDPAWLSAYQQKRKSMPAESYHGYNNSHWMVQEAEQRRLAEQQARRTSLNTKAPSNPNNTSTNSSNSNGKPLPDSIIQTLTERVQSKGIGERKRFDNYSSSNNSPSHLATNYQPRDQTLQQNYSNVLSPVKHQAMYQQQQPQPLQQPSSHSNGITATNGQDKVLSVSGKKKCSHCGEELGRGAAMIIESLLLFYHINCFKCCVCHVQLGDGLNGTDVRVRNHKLHCQNCYSSDDGIKFSCV